MELVRTRLKAKELARQAEEDTYHREQAYQARKGKETAAKKG